MDSFDTNFRAVKHEVEEVYAAFLTERETGKSLFFEALVVTNPLKFSSKPAEDAQRNPGTPHVNARYTQPHGNRS